MNIFGWSKWELVAENVPQIQEVRSSPILGFYLISRTRVFVDILRRENIRSGKIKYKKVIK